MGQGGKVWLKRESILIYGNCGHLRKLKENVVWDVKIMIDILRLPLTETKITKTHGNIHDFKKF